MSQIIACKNKKGIILACDSKALDFDFQGNLVERNIKRLCQLTTQTSIITCGSAEGKKMCESLKDFVGQENLLDIEDVYNAALPFLASEYEHFMLKACEYLPVHFLLHLSPATAFIQFNDLFSEQFGTIVKIADRTSSLDLPRGGSASCACLNKKNILFIPSANGLTCSISRHFDRLGRAKCISKTGFL